MRKGIKKVRQLKRWPVMVQVYLPAEHPCYPHVALRIYVDMPGETAQEAAETMLALPRAQWPAEWEVKESAVGLIR